MEARYAADAIAVVTVGRRRLYCCSHACRRIDQGVARARAAVVGVRVVAGFRRRPSALATRALHGYLWFVGLKICGVAAVAVGQDANEGHGWSYHDSGLASLRRMDGLSQER